ncbi:MAG: response regulator [Treponema sp.]|nr:response regulator [Treponema sp.]
MKKARFLIITALAGAGILGAGAVASASLQGKPFLLILLFLALALAAALALIKESWGAAKESELRLRSLAAVNAELRTPMTSIVGLTEHVMDLRDIPKKARDYLVKIKGNSLSVIDSVTDFLDASSLASGKIRLNQTPFSLHELLEHLETTAQLKAQEKGLDVYFYSESFMETKLLGDPVRLRQILLYLLSNGIKYTNSGTIKLMAAMEGQEEGEIAVRFEVKDSGIGMTAKQIARIGRGTGAQFDWKYGGAAVAGLPAVKKFIELMGGALEVESSLGIGSKFSFVLRFPRRPEADGRAVKEEILMVEQRRPAFKGSVLICEDNPINQDVVEEQLKQTGLHPVIVENGKQGLDAAVQRMEAGEPFDLILMDIQMPVMDGLEASMELHRRGCKTPIVAMTANILSQNREIYRKHGITDYLIKPFVAQELWRCLTKHLGSGEGEPEQEMWYTLGFQAFDEEHS